MITKNQQMEAQERAAKMCAAAGIVLSEYEQDNIEVVDEGLDDLYHTGLQIVTYINTERVCAKEIILFPYQTCPEHMHPVVDEYIGKEETFRCRWGTVYLYTPGEKTVNAHAVPPEGSEQFYTVWNEIILRPGDQYTIHPNTFHWFQSGAQGAIVSEFSTNSMDETDIFTNPFIKRITVIAED
ncbi:MAG: D-lyxose/D-mannose family sugar isomerase [Saccharofermentanales bacterium]